MSAHKKARGRESSRRQCDESVNPAGTADDRFHVQRRVLHALAAISVAVVLAPLGHTGAALAAASQLDPAAEARDAAWVKSAIRPDGAIATNPDQRLVWPYLANFAASGLA